MRSYSQISWGILLLSLACTANAADPVAWLPSDVNAVARINVSDLYKSPVATKENWFKKSTEAFVQQELFVPPGTQQIVMGAELDLSRGLEATRKYSIIVPDKEMTLQRLTGWLPGTLEKVDGKTVGNFGKDGYVADSGDGSWLTSSGSNRQTVVRWLKNGPGKSANQISPYLKSALESQGTTAQAILAIDLKDNFSESKLVGQLRETDWFKSEADITTVAQALESAEGITISLIFDEARTGKVSIEFGKDAGVLSPVLEKLVDAVVEHVGGAPEDFVEWKWKAIGRHVTGTGPLTAGRGRRLLSVLDPPSITQSIPATPTEPPPSKEESASKVSLKYSKSLQTLLSDLRANLKSVNHNYTMYYEQYARKIDALPTLNVDSELLDFAGRVSSSFRYQSQNIRMNNIGRGTRVAEAASSSYVSSYGTYYAAGPNTALAIGAEANQASKGVVFAEWKQIEDGLVTVRRKMTEKYKVQF